MKEFKGEQIAEEQLESLLDKLVYEERKKGEINVYDTYDQSMLVCGMYEFEDVLVMEIKYNYDD